MSNECGNCGSFITDDYVRVFAPPDEDTVRVCPRCPDKVRNNGQVREARSARRTSGGESA